MPKKKKDELADLSGFTSSLSKAFDKATESGAVPEPKTKVKDANPVTLGSRVLSPEDWKAKQIERATTAAPYWESRVMHPRKLPTEAAIAQTGKRYDKLEEAKRTKKWEKAMEKVDVDVMYDVISKTGASGFRAGIDKRDAKIGARVKELQPLVTALAEELDKLPTVTDADREKKLLAARRGMIELGKKRRGLK